MRIFERLAAVTVIVALAALPALASGEDMKKKEDPKAAAAQAGEAKALEAKAGDAKAAGTDAVAGAQTKKKNCPTDGSFNTMEDMFGAEEVAAMLAAHQQRLAQDAQTVQWQAVAEPEDGKDEKKKKSDKSKD
ncbi:MAG TPA: hypothetical protein VD788_12455 [Candidatus Polarisedimenticolaceae bacterium]|nr:hypothetical protein [Candidatus Polarisedimenticolaceae bacterium]